MMEPLEEADAPPAADLPPLLLAAETPLGPASEVARAALASAGKPVPARVRHEQRGPRGRRQLT